MKAVAALSVLSLLFLVPPARAQFPFDLASLDFASIQPFLQNRALVRRSLACVTGTGPCDAIGLFARRAVVEVLSRNCQSCTPQQARTGSQILEFVRINYPTEYAQIYNRYRPSG